MLKKGPQMYLLVRHWWIYFGTWSLLPSVWLHFSLLHILHILQQGHRTQNPFLLLWRLEMTSKLSLFCYSASQDSQKAVSGPELGMRAVGWSPCWCMVSEDPDLHLIGRVEWRQAHIFGWLVRQAKFCRSLAINNIWCGVMVGHGETWVQIVTQPWS